ncbi:MAG: T9SS type A sorting domain-containing protein [Bacteroidales bacterium]
MTSFITIGLVSFLILWNKEENAGLIIQNELTTESKYYQINTLKNKEDFKIVVQEQDKMTEKKGAYRIVIDNIENEEVDTLKNSPQMEKDIQIIEEQNDIEPDSGSGYIEGNYSNRISDVNNFGIEGIHLIELEKNEYEKLGFKIDKDKLIIQIKVKGWEVFITKQGMGCRSQDIFHRQRPDVKLVFLSDTKGLQRIKWSAPGDDKDKFEDEYFEKKIPYLVPILMRQNNFPEILEEDEIFWFEPSEPLFEALPERIGIPLRKEYSLLQNDDISISPEQNNDCNFYEICKSTLRLHDCKVYPNPAKDYITLEFNSEEQFNGSISLISISGVILKQWDSPNSFSSGYNSLKLDLTDLKEGIYLLRINSSNRFKTMRLMVID